MEISHIAMRPPRDWPGASPFGPHIRMWLINLTRRKLRFSVYIPTLRLGMFVCRRTIRSDFPSACSIRATKALSNFAVDVQLFELQGERIGRQPRK